MVKRNVLILGMVGDGKSSVANRIIGREVFEVSNYPKFESATNAVQAATAIHYCFEVKVIDTPGILDMSMSTKEVILAVKSYVKTHIPEGIHLILTTFRYGRFTRENKTVFDTIISSLCTEASCISALIVTQCEMKSSEQRARIKRAFSEQDNTRDLYSYMKKGLYFVGFPNLNDCDLNDCDELFLKTIESQGEQDTQTLRELIYACPVSIKDIFK